MFLALVQQTQAALSIPAGFLRTDNDGDNAATLAYNEYAYVTPSTSSGALASGKNASASPFGSLVFEDFQSRGVVTIAGHFASDNGDGTFSSGVGGVNSGAAIHIGLVPKSAIDAASAGTRSSAFNEGVFIDVTEFGVLVGDSATARSTIAVIDREKPFYFEFSIDFTTKIASVFTVQDGSATVAESIAFGLASNGSIENYSQALFIAQMYNPDVEGVTSHRGDFLDLAVLPEPGSALILVLAGTAMLYRWKR